MRDRGLELRRENDGLPNIKTYWSDDDATGGYATNTENPCVFINLYQVIQFPSRMTVTNILIHELVHWYDARLSDPEFREIMRKIPYGNRLPEIDAYAITHDLIMEKYNYLCYIYL